MNSQTVSIITPCFNSEDYLDEMMHSVVSQTYKNWELIIVDDCSTDNSLIIIGKYLVKYEKIKLIKLNKRSGAAFARNKAIEFARGRYLAFLDSDDYWERNFLKYSLECIKGHEFIYSSYNRVNKNRELIDKSDIIQLATKDEVLKGTPISCLTAFIDTKKIGKFFFPLNANREDLAYWILLLDKCNCAYGFNFCEANYRLHKNSSSANKIKMAFLTAEDYFTKYNLNLFQFVFFFSNYALNGILKTIKRSLKKLKDNFHKNFL